MNKNKKASQSFDRELREKTVLLSFFSRKPSACKISQMEGNLGKEVRSTTADYYMNLVGIKVIQQEWIIPEI